MTMPTEIQNGKWLDQLKAIVRPVITLSGWGIVCWLVAKFVGQITDASIIAMIVAFFLGAVSMALGFWFGQRGVQAWTGK